MYVCFFFQAEDGIRDLVRSRGLGDVYKRQVHTVGAVAAVVGRPGRLGWRGCRPRGQEFFRWQSSCGTQHLFREHDAARDQ